MTNQSNSSIYYSPSKIIQILDNTIDLSLEAIQNYCLDPVSNFTRLRKLPNVL